MKIPDDIMKKWNELRTYGDFKKIAAAAGITRNDVTRAFRNGECSDTVFVAVAGFYKEREEKVKPFVQAPQDTQQLPALQPAKDNF